MGLVVVINTVVMLLVSSLQLIAVVHGGRVYPSQYFVTSPATFREVDVFDPRPPVCFPSIGGYACASGGAPLTDGDTATQPVNLSSQEFIRSFNPWSRTQESPYIIFSFGTFVTIATIGLSYLNYPSENTSLPNLRVFEAISTSSATGGIIIPYTLRGNGELSTDDQEVVTVYLDLFPAEGNTLRYIGIEMSFSGLSDTDWFLLSEVTFNSSRSNTELPAISFAQPDTSLQLYEGDTLQLTCTVTVDGLFEWEWMKDDQTRTATAQIQTTLATRRAILTIPDVCASESGNYTCEAQHVNAASTKQSRTTAVTIPGGLQVRVDPQLTVGTGESIALTCAVSGYDGDLNDITWAREEDPDTPLSDSSSKYTIERVSKTHSSGGDCNSVSVSVILMIHNLVSGDAGGYICRAAGGAQATTTLTVTDLDEPPNPTTTSLSAPMASSSPHPTVPVSPTTSTILYFTGSPGGSSGGGGGNAGAIAGGVVVGLVFIAALTAMIIVIIFLVKRRPHTTKNTDLAQEVVYEDMDNMKVDYQAGAIATELNKAYGHATAGAIATDQNEAYGHATAGTTHTGQVTMSSQVEAYETIDGAGLDDHYATISENPNRVYETVAL